MLYVIDEFKPSMLGVDFFKASFKELTLEQAKSLIRKGEYKSWGIHDTYFFDLLQVPIGELKHFQFDGTNSSLLLALTLSGITFWYHITLTTSLL